MRTSGFVFLSSATFGAVVALVYWLTTRENVGTVLLGLFAAGLGFVYGYFRVIRPKARVDGDLERTPAELAGETIGVFSTESPWPVILACCTAALLIGITLHPMLAVLASVGLFGTLWQLVRESV